MPASCSKNSKDNPDISGLEASIGYTFRDKRLLLNALTHKSFHHEYPKEATVYNERLEFFGDSVLGLVVSEYLFKSDALYSESMMSKIRSHVVKGTVLYKVAERLSLGKYLLLGKGEEETGGRQKRSILSDALEAVFGAVYVDGGYDASKGLIMRLFKDMIDGAISSKNLFDHKTALQEESQMRFGLLPEYRLIRQEGQEHNKLFTVEVFISGENYGMGKGQSKKEAEGLAAKEALEKFKIQN